MRYLIALAPLALLAACGGNKAANNSAANNVAPANSATTNAAAPVAPPVTMAPGAPAGDNPRRAEMLAECSGAMVKGIPAGADVTALCNCAVDRVMANREGEEQATMACAGQLGIPVDATKM